MAQKVREDLKKLFQAGDKLRMDSFIDLIESLVSTQEDSNISGSLMPTKGNTFNLGSAEFPWKEIFVSKNSIKLVDTTTGETETLSKEDVTQLKAIEAQRKTQDGIPVKKVRGFTSSSTFIDLEASNQQTGDRIDIKVANTFEAASFSTSRTSIGPKESVPLELTGSLKIKQSLDTPHEFLGKYQFKGNPDNFGNAGKGVELLNDVGFKYEGSKDKIEFKPEGGVSFTGGNVVIEDAITSQPGTISQSINIGTFNTPSIAEYIGVEGNKRISIAPGVKVSVNPGSRLIIKPQQPNILADSTTGDITLTSTDGGDISFNVGSFGTNPKYIGFNMEIPAGNSAAWYGPIHIGRTFVPINGGTVPRLTVTNKGNLRIKEDARLRIKDFNE
tara:strand:+ start:177 stop:1337 length:1161 start_codon:yes stop_codon:yes gene_type:complete